MVAVLDYGIGNLRSAQKALERVGADARLTDDPDLVARAAAVVLPGVGAFGRCMEALQASGLDRVALDAVASGRPFLGICVGMQLLYEGSDESPGVAGLGVLPGVVRLLPPGVKRPQMQWNVLDAVRPSALLATLPDPAWVYFVHSYAAEPSADVVATCDYGGAVVAAVERGPLWATQFHPEKSGPAGLALLRGFAAAARSAAAAA
ncbi:MAG: imidazole glycerol phosphate synthase subunit HisH [Acidimicrobiales bacterium]|nr:imidazole glycerol phosphate synthase subunit HisH [Acidimicrobiales bacterium]